jgi:hypothetical protein
MPDETVDVAKVLQGVREAVRQQRLLDQAGLPPIGDAVERLEAFRWLPLVPSVEDIPSLSRFARWRVVGAVLTFARQFSYMLWVLTHKRAPWWQQMRFNDEATDALRQLTRQLEVLQAQQDQLRREITLLRGEPGERRTDSSNP